MFFCPSVSPTLECKALEGALFWSPHSPARSQAPDAQETPSKQLCSEGTGTGGVNRALRTQLRRESLHSRGTARERHRDDAVCSMPVRGVPPGRARLHSFTSTSLKSAGWLISLVHSAPSLLSRKHHQALCWAALPGLRRSSRGGGGGR